MDKAQFIDYLSSTLIPKLKSSGRYNEAGDLNTCLKIMTRKSRMTASAKSNFLKSLHLLWLSPRMFEDPEVTEAFETCIEFIEGVR